MAARSAKAPTEPRAFVAWENRRKGRYELIGGEIRLMAGGNRAHDLVAGNVLTALRLALRGRECDVHGSNLKVTSPAGMVTYPDVFVRCGPLADEAIERDDPVVVVEVLSPSTRSEDLVRKRWAYQAIPTLAHLVSTLLTPRSSSRPALPTAAGGAPSSTISMTGCIWKA